jgi:hypothetical protein
MFLPINVVADYKTCSNIFGFRSSQKLTIPKSTVSQKIAKISVQSGKKIPKL